MIPFNEFRSLDSFYQPLKGVIHVRHQHPSSALQGPSFSQRQIRPGLQ